MSREIYLAPVRSTISRLNSNETLSLAIVGCGDLTRRTILPHLALADAKSIARVEAVCDLDAAIARGTASEFEIPSHYTNYETMLAQCEAEAMLIVVPPHLHGDYARKAAQSGRHVYVQKPLAPTLSECDALLTAVEAAGVHLVCAPHQGLWPLYPRLRDLLQNGDWGPVYTVHGPFLGWAGYNLGHSSDPKWCFSRGSGPLRDHGVYSLTAMISMLGPVMRVGAMGNVRSPKRAWNGVEFDVEELDNLALTLEFGSGALGTLAESWCSTSDNSTTFRINALEGVIEGSAKFAGYHGIFPLEATLRRNGRETELWRVNPTDIPFLNGEHATLWNPHIWADIRHLCLAIRGEEALAPSGETARHVVQIIEAAHLSTRENRFISLSRL